MKIYSEVLSKELLDTCKKDIIKKQHQHVWCSSSFSWDKKVLRKIDGACISTTSIDKEIVNLLTEEIEIAFKNYQYNTLYFQYYIWDSYSGISLHNDASYKFGATLYLNSNIIEDGGLFVWQDAECPNNFYRCLNPQENMMVVNDNKENHLVTPVSPHALEYRYTIQIWGR